MRPRSGCDRDEGSAIVEFCFLGLLLLVPLAYVVLAVFHVQAAAYAVSAASREAGRAFVTAGAQGDAFARAEAAAAVALSDHGVDLAAVDLAIDCSAAPCLQPGERVHVAIDVAVPLPFVPEILGAVPASITVSGEHAEIVDRYRAIS